ncbi:transcription attenuation protein MtrB [Christensenellaceae bacterium]|nr:transcription attenuation protein MtrB [Christensenellaceae bacterium]BDF62063.1 transcription attenuation protein MtrB [Christensenellaceae bacterium]
MDISDKSTEEYVVIKALESGVNVIGMTRGKDTRLQHTEKLTAGDVLLAQFTDNISAIKISGKARILTKHGEIFSGDEEV